MPGALTANTPDTPDPRGRKVAEYKVFWNKPQRQRVLVLQFPNRKKEEALSKATGNKPLEVRLKPNSGLVEVDVPIPIDKCYDSLKGVQFSQALRQSKTLQNEGEYGLAGGFGTQIHGQSRAGRSSSQNASTGYSEEEILDNFESAVRHGHALNKITLGGRIRTFKAGDPIYAIGAFDHNELHLTKVDAICSLQPQFHHLDAIVDNERSLNRASGPADHTESEARAVNLAVKSIDDEDLDMGEVGKTLKAIQEERWQRLDWVDEDDERSYFTYANSLMMSDNLKTTRLISNMSEKQYLDAISAPRIDPIYQGKNVMMSRPWSSSDEEEGLSSTDEDDDDQGGRM